MLEKIYSNAFNEVLTILAYVSAKEYNKIPKELIEVFEKYSNNEYEFTYDPSLTLNEQNVSYEAKLIIAILFRDYWATDFQKEKILLKEKYNLQQIEEEKKAKYSVDDIFKNKHCETSIVAIDTYKETIWKKIIKRMKKLLSFKT